MHNHLRQAGCYPHSQEGRGDKAVCIELCARKIESVIMYDSNDD